MIRYIPNQPINFGPSLLAGCLCDEIEPPLLIDPEEDSIIFQMVVDMCDDAENQIDNPDFQGTNWKAGLGWTLFPGQACGSGGAATTLQETDFVPVVGDNYVLRFVVASVRDTVTWSFAGNSGTFGTTGTNTAGFTIEITVEAFSTAGLVITLDTVDSEICFNLIGAYAANRGIEVEVIDADGTSLGTWDPDNDAAYFTFTDDIMSVEIPIGDVAVTGCFTVRVTNTCGDVVTVLNSQTLKVVDAGCTLKVRVCNDTAALGFAPTPLEMRLNASLTHPTYAYEVTGQRRSNGRTINNYVDRQRKMELRVGLQSEWVHPFLAAIPVFSHFYVGQEEFVVDAEEYAPLYGDVFEGTGGIVLNLTPKEELFRRVQCEAEGNGCLPPPNLWVQGTGPNNDYVITQANQTIELVP